MKKKGPLFFLVTAIVLLYGLQSCSKSNSDGIETVYNIWTFTHAHGLITVNGNPIAASESSNTNGYVTVQFQKDGSYHFQVKSLVDETSTFVRSDSTLEISSDTSNLAIACAYPQVYFTTTPGEKPPVQHVSRNLQIVYVSNDSLLLSTRLTKPGVNAPDTVYTEYTGFRK